MKSGLTVQLHALLSRVKACTQHTCVSKETVHLDVIVLMVILGTVARSVCRAKNVPTVTQYLILTF